MIQIFTNLKFGLARLFFIALVVAINSTKLLAQGFYEPTYSSPTQIYLYGNTKVCVGSPTSFSASSQGGTCGSWYWGGGDIISTSDDQATITWNTAGTYTVWVSAACSDDIGGGTSQPSASLTVTVVDKPANQFITISSSGISNVTHTSANICPQTDAHLYPPSGATNCVWRTNVPQMPDGKYTIDSYSDGSIYTNWAYGSQQFTLTYTLPNAGPCPLPALTFALNVTPLAHTPVVTSAERFGSGSVTLTIKDYNPIYTYTWYENATSSTIAPITHLSGGDFATPSLSQSRSYYLTITSCKESERQQIPVIVRTIRILADGQVPTKPVPLKLGTGLTLQADPANVGPYTWLLNGLPITGTNISGAQLTVYEPGSYVVRKAGGSGTDYESTPVEVLPALAGQSVNNQPLTYTSELTVLKPNVTDPTQLIKLGAAERRQTVTYANGLGQAIQRVAVQAGPNQEDIVQHLSYEGSVTTAQTFLPFSVTTATKTQGEYEANPTAKQLAYYAPQDAQPFNTNAVEASPLGRPLEQTQTGQAWAGHSTRLSYDYNAVSEVRRWQGFDGTQFYDEGQLTKEISLDPDNRRTEVFKDHMGRVVLQRKITGTGTGAENFDTYTVYAEAGYVQLVIPPAAIKALAASGQWTIQDASFKDRWLYQYTYDDRGRAVERKFPGAAAVYLVYDQFDRPILVQDGNRRGAGSGQWLFTKFDAQNRTVAEGIWLDSRSRQDVQAAADQFTQTQTVEYEARDASTGGYTTTNTFPAVQDGTSGTVLSFSFYDNYDLNGDSQPDYNYRAAPELSTAEQPIPTSQTRGLATITRRRIIASNGQYGDWLTTALFYDQYGNVIQKQGNNILQPSPSLLDVTTLVYREQGFVPQVLRTIKKQDYSGTSPVIVRNRFTYDASGHPLQAWQQNQTQGNLEQEVLLSSNAYTGLGELTQKKLHSTDAGTTFLQYEDFSYDLHGQLKAINNSDNLLVSNPDNDLFALAILREQSSSAIGATPRYDGGICAITWTTHNAIQTNQPERQRSYRFIYDGLGRMTDALFQARPVPSTGWYYEQGAYDEKNITYDGNGNITAVKRYTQASSSAAIELIDNLALDYGNSATLSNRLLSAYDYQQDTRGFGNGSSNAYSYDSNGNVISDGHKNATFQYNVLNKVDKQAVNASSIVYTYDAAGTVLRKVTTTGSVKTEYFIDGFVYENSTEFNGFGLRSVPTLEGRAVALQQNPTHLVYEYHLRDHLGNLRVAFRARQDEILRLAMENPSQEEGEYPRFKRVSSSQSPAGISYHGPSNAPGSYSAAVTASQPGPSTRIPMVQGDKLQVSLYYQTPNGTQYFVRPATSFSSVQQPQPASTSMSNVPLWHLAPLLVAPSSTNTREARPTMGRPIVGAQLSVTGLLSNTFTKYGQVTRLQSKHISVSPTEVSPSYTAATTTNPVVAYVALRVYDSHNQLLSQSTQQAKIVNTQDWNKLRFVFTPDLSSLPEKAGFVEVQLLNDGSQPVYFDSLTIRQPQQGLLVTQENHYYPYGLPMSGVAVNTIAQQQISKDQFNGGSALQDGISGSEAGIYSTFYRNYDPTTGRFQGVDPLADVYTSSSPYAFGLNDPISFNDPEGDEPPQTYGQAVDQMYGEGWYAQFGRGGTNSAFYGSSAFGPAMGTYLPGTSIGGDYSSSTGYLNTVAAAINMAFTNIGASVKNGTLGYYRSFSWNGQTAYGEGNTRGNNLLSEVTVGMQFVAFDKNTILDNFQTGLDIVGLVPGLGEAADGANALIYLARGDKVNAGLSLAAMIPIAGVAATGAKFAKKASGAMLPAVWGGLRNYKGQGVITAIQHVMQSHGWNTVLSNKGRFALGTTEAMVKDYVSEALRLGNGVMDSSGLLRISHDLGSQIGVNQQGQAASSIMVLIRNMEIHTAFPF